MSDVKRSMRSLILIAAAMSPPLSSHGEKEKAPDAAREALAGKIRAAFPYVSATNAGKQAQAEPESQVVMLERVTVTAFTPLGRLKPKIDTEREKAKAAQFSFTQGGALFKKDFRKVRFEMGAWGSGSGLNLLKISW